MRLALAPVAILAGGLFLASNASAAVIGTLGTGTSGSLTVTLNSLTFNNDPSVIAGSGNSDVTNTTQLSFAGCPPPGAAGSAGCLLIRNGITINNNDLTTSPPSQADANTFLTFVGFPNLVFSETLIGPGSPNTNCATANANGLSCSVFAGSPILLTYSNGNTIASLSVKGNASDTGTAGLATGSAYIGGFSQTIAGQTPKQLQDFFCPNGTCNFGNSPVLTVNNVGGGFTVTAVPEPNTLALLLVGGALIGVNRLRRRTFRA